MKISILHEDEYFLVIDKPSKLPSQPTVDKSRPDVFTLLKKQVYPMPVFLHHRLDKDTSGVLLFSKSKMANGPLTEMFQKHEFQKRYWALSTPKADIPNRWIIENHLTSRKDSSKLMKMFATESGGDFAETHFKLLSQNAQAVLIEAKPITGRTHQIRVHCEHSGIPILGDTLYGGTDPQVPRLMLHAKSLEFAHPVTGESIKIEAPLPPDFVTLMDKWGLRPNDVHNIS